MLMVVLLLVVLVAVVVRGGGHVLVVADVVVAVYVLVDAAVADVATAVPFDVVGMRLVLLVLVLQMIHLSRRLSLLWVVLVRLPIALVWTLHLSLVWLGQRLLLMWW